MCKTWKYFEKGQTIIAYGYDSYESYASYIGSGKYMIFVCLYALLPCPHTTCKLSSDTKRAHS